MTRLTSIFLALLIATGLTAQDRPPRPPQQDPQRQELERLAKRCGRDIKWRHNIEKALERVKETGELILAYVYERSRSSKFGNQFKDHFMMAGPLMDTELVAFIDRKFFPVRLNLTGVVAEELGINLGSVVVPGLLFIDGEGNVLHKFDRIATCSTEQIFQVCRQVLKKFPKFDRPSSRLKEIREKHKQDPDHLRTHYRLGLETMRDGEFENAIAVFEEVIRKAPDSREAVESGYRMGRCHRRLRNADPALKAVAGARERNRSVGVRIEGDLMLEEATIHIRQGDFGEARKVLKDALEKHPNSNRTPQIKYTLGALLTLERKPKEAKKIWQDLVDNHKEDRWAARAASELTGLGPLGNGWEVLIWLPEDVLAAELDSTERNRKLDDWKDALEEGVDYLLRNQKADGSWHNVQVRFTFTESATVIALHALHQLRHIRPEENAEARKRGREFFEKWVDRKQPGQGMKVWPYIMGLDAYLAFLQDAETEEEKKHYREVAEELLRGLMKVQQKDGGWSYAGAGASSFTSAGAILVIWKARERDLKIDETAVEKAIKQLQSVKDPKRDTYWYTHQASSDFDHGAPQGAAGRGALCYLAEHVWDKVKDDRLIWSVELFMKYRHKLERIRKSTDWHGGKYANAPYFFFYDHYWFSQALRRLDPDTVLPDTKATFRKAASLIIQDLMKIVEIDGTWVDWHIAGKNYGAAMALMILKNCALVRGEKVGSE